MVKGYFISSRLEDMDVKAIHRNISSSYWARNIPLDVLNEAIKNSLCFGVFTDSNQQVGFARMVTDYSTFAYLADVYIEEPHQGKGLSKWLMKEVHDHKSMQGLRRIMLCTKDAHGLYKQAGYKQLNDESWFMEIWNPELYQK